jgi:hypothetical protein
VSESRKRHQHHNQVPDDLEHGDKLKLIDWLKTRQDKGDFLWVEGPKDLRRLVDDCLGWHAAKGNPGRYSDWLAVCRRWIIKSDTIRDRDRQAGKRETFTNLDGPVRLRVVK